MREAHIMGLVKTRRLAAMQKQQRAKAGMNAAGTGPAKPLKNGPFVGPVPKSSKYNFKAFTEKGLYMLATILKSKRATDASSPS